MRCRNGSLKLSAGLLVLTLLVVVIPQAAFAGPPEALIVGGAVDSQPIGDEGDLLGEEGRTSTTFGFGLLLKFGRYFAVEMDGRYTRKGASGKADTRYTQGDSTGGFILDAAVNLDYIEVPLLFAGVLPVGDRSELRGYVGASANFLISTQITGTLNGEAFDHPVENVNDIDWAGVAGVSYEYRMDTIAFVFDGRFVGSLSSIDDTSDGEASVKLRAFEFTIGLGIPLGAGHY